MIHLGLLGHRLEHSLSPVLHAAALRASGLPGSYALYPVQPGEATSLRHLVSCIRTGELTGLNVTIPHKKSVIPFLDKLTPTARASSAVNTLYLKGGNVVGDNTDAPGFLADLQLFLPRPRSALVLGAGGAASAVVYSLCSIGCEVTVASRRIEQAGELAARFMNVKAVELSSQGLQESHVELIANATPAGMFPDTGTSAWPASLPFSRNAAVYDLVYNPPVTQLLSAARAAGLRGINGLGMLIEQAALAFELWTRCRVPREVLLDAIGQAAH